MCVLKLFGWGERERERKREAAEGGFRV